MPNIQMTYGDYSFVPVPLMHIQKNFNKQGDGIIIGSYFTTTLNGSLYEPPPSGGLASVIQAQDVLRTAFAQQGKLFLLTCDNSILISAYPRIVSPPDFPQSQDNWTQRSDYTIVLEYDTDPTPYYSGDAGLSGYENAALSATGYISEFHEEWAVEIIEDFSQFSINLGTSVDSNPFQFRLTHNVGAIGKLVFGPSGQISEPWQQAQQYIIPYLGFSLPYLEASGVLNINSGATPYNYVRTNQTNRKEGQYDVTETWLALSSGAPCIETYTVDYKKSLQSDISAISINGLCQGLEVRNYGTKPGDLQVTSNKFDNATAYFNSINGFNKIFPRCSYFAANIPTSRTLNPTPLDQSIAYSPSQGNISYSYSFNDRPLNCIPGALFESITIDSDNTTDVFASIPIIGRIAGPVLQAMNTVTSPARTIMVDVIVPPSTGCTVNLLFATNPRVYVSNFILQFYNDMINGGITQIFKSQDKENWQPKEGHYNRTVTYVYSEGCT